MVAGSGNNLDYGQLSWQVKTVTPGVPVQDRERPGEAEAHRADVGVGRGSEGRAAAAKDLGPREELRVDLESDDRLVRRHGYALS